MTLLKDSGWIFGKIPAGTSTWIQNAGFTWVLSLVPLFLLLWWLRRGERHVEAEASTPTIDPPGAEAPGLHPEKGSEV